MTETGHDVARYYTVILGPEIIRVRIANGRAIEWKPADAPEELKRAALEQVAKIEPLAE